MLYFNTNVGATLLGSQPINVVRMLEARNCLAKIKASIQPSDWRLLMAVGDEVGKRGKRRTSGAVRVKMCRLRKRIRVHLNGPQSTLPGL